MPMANVIGMLGGGAIKEPLVPEVEWYPWFNRGRQ
jgi:hypothetical protein